MRASTAFDPRTVLAMNLATQPGVYALLLGSGASRAAGIPTGWGVVEQLVRKVAAADPGNPIVGDDWELWWSANHPERPLGYSELLELVGPTPAARKALLAGFFEATDDDRGLGSKVPGEAHQAIARLVAEGFIRVIVTTNFDRLIEHALDAAGVTYQVISEESAVVGMEPLPHATATVVKLHGDYTSLNQRNTVTELAGYPEATSALLGRIFDEYGLIVSGWSGDWDHALVSALESRRNRRYPLVWSSFHDAGSIARRLTAARGNLLIEHTTADEFFPDLRSRVQATTALSETPASLEIKLARLRQALPDPVRHLEVRGLFEVELDALSMWAVERGRVAPALDAAGQLGAVTSIRSRFDTLLHLFGQGILLDRDRQHTDLWVWVLQRALDVRPGGASGPVDDWWDRLTHLPAYLLLRAGVLAALAANHEEAIVRLCVEPRWSSVFIQNGAELPAHAILSGHAVFEHHTWQEVLYATDEQRYLWPASHLTRALLGSTATQLSGATGADRTLNRMEYRLALASTLLRPGNQVYYQPASAGEFLVGERYRADRSQLAISADFRDNGDRRPWQANATPPVDDLDSVLSDLDERLRSILDSTH